MNEKLICKCCKAQARWCDSKPDKGGREHVCDHIHCDHCNMHYSLEGPHPSSIEIVGKAKARMLDAYYNKRARAPTYMCERGHAHKTEEAKTACASKNFTGLTHAELVARSKPRFLDAYKKWIAGAKKSEIAESLGVSKEWAGQIISRGYRYALKDGTATKCPYG